MIVAVRLVAVMKVARNEIIRVIAVWYRFVATARAVSVIRGMPFTRVRRRAGGRVRRGYIQFVLVDVTLVHVKEMPVVKKIDMIGMPYLRVRAVCGAMVMAVIGVSRMFHVPS